MMDLASQLGLAVDDRFGLLRYVPVQSVSDAVKARWFAWRTGGRLNGVLRSTLGTEELVGEQGYSTCQSALNALDSEFERLLSGHRAAPVWTCVRNVSPIYWAPEAWQAHSQCRRIAEIAIERHCSWDYSGPLPSEWGSSEIRVAGRCFATAEAYNNVLVARRRIAKGQTGRVADWSPLNVEFDDQDDIDRLIDLRDRRAQLEDNPLASLASLGSPPRRPRFVRRPSRVEASFADPSDLRRDCEARAFVSEAPTSFGLSVAKADIVTNWSETLGAPELAEWFAPYDDDLRRELGYTMSDLLAVHALLTRIAVPRYRPGCWIPPSLEFCGYAAIDSSAVNLSVASSTARSLGLARWESVTDESARAALESLTKGGPETNIRSLARHPIARLGTSVLVDFASFNLEYHLVNRLAAADYFTRTNPFDFEARVHAELSDLGSQPIGPGHSVSRTDGPLTDIDASVVVGDTFVAVDCFASPWRDDLDEGTHAATRNRVSTLTSKLSEWDSKMRKLGQSPPPWMRDSGVRQILPVVVSATAEWINSTDASLWFTEELPRICTTTELVGQVIPGIGLWDPHTITVAP